MRLLTLVVLLGFSHQANAVKLPWSLSTTDYLVRLQALAYVREVPAQLKAIDDREEKAKTDREAAHKVEQEKLDLAKAEVLKKLQLLKTAIAAEKEPARKEEKAAKGKKKAELAALREQLQEDEEDFNKKTEALKSWTPAVFGGTTQDQVDEAKEKLDNTRLAVEALELAILKKAALDPSPELSQALLITESAKLGIENQLASLAATIALPADMTKRFNAEREGRKNAALCMIIASGCTDKKKYPLKVDNFAQIKDVAIDLNRCTESNLTNASKALAPNLDISCETITKDSGSQEIQACVNEYRTKVLGKPEIADSYAEYDKCAGMAAIE